MRYEKPEMDIIIFEENDIARTLEVSNVGDGGGSLEFDTDFNG